MKKILLTLGIIVGMVLIFYFVLAYLGLTPYYKCDSVGCNWVCMESGFRKCSLGMFGTNYDRISYRDRAYNLGGQGTMTVQELKENNFGEVAPTGIFYHSREIYDSAIGSQYVPTVIFLKQKNTERLDIYALVGGP